VTACFKAAVGRYGNCEERCSDANSPSNEFPRDDRTSFVSVDSSANCVKSESSAVVSPEMSVLDVVNDGCVKQATRTGWRVVLGGNDNRESNADKAVGVGILLGGVAVVGRGAKEIGVVDIVRDGIGVAR